MSAFVVTFLDVLGLRDRPKVVWVYAVPDVASVVDDMTVGYWPDPLFVHPAMSEQRSTMPSLVSVSVGVDSFPQPTAGIVFDPQLLQQCSVTV